jgi:hypothetical protein
MPFMQAIDRGVPVGVVLAALIRRGLFTQEDFDKAGSTPAVAPQLPADPNEVIV